MVARKNYTIENRHVKSDGCLYELLDYILWIRLFLDILPSLFRYAYYRKRLGFIAFLKQEDDNKLIIYRRGNSILSIKEVVYEETIPEGFSEFELADIYDRLQKQIDNESIEDTLRVLNEDGETLFGIQGPKVRLGFSPVN